MIDVLQYYKLWASRIVTCDAGADYCGSGIDVAAEPGARNRLGYVHGSGEQGGDDH